MRRGWSKKKPSPKNAHFLRLDGAEPKTLPHASLLPKIVLRDKMFFYVRTTGGGGGGGEGGGGGGGGGGEAVNFPLFRKGTFRRNSPFSSFLPLSHPKHLGLACGNEKGRMPYVQNVSAASIGKKRGGGTKSESRSSEEEKKFHWLFFLLKGKVTLSRYGSNGTKTKATGITIDKVFSAPPLATPT